MGREEEKKNRKGGIRGKRENKMFLEENIFLHVWFAQEKERKINDLTFMPLIKNNLALNEEHMQNL